MAPNAEEPVTMTISPQDNLDTVSAAKEEAPIDDDATEAPSEHPEGVEAELEESAPAGFSLSCCGIGTKGTCPHCQQTITYAQECVTIEFGNSKYAHMECYQEEETKKQEQLENENATKIQKKARGNIARGVVITKKVEKVEEERRAQEEALKAEEAKAKAEAEAIEAAEAKKQEEEALAAAVVEAAAVEAAAATEAEGKDRELAAAELEKSKKSKFGKKLRKVKTLFSNGCKKADKQVTAKAQAEA